MEKLLKVVYVNWFQLRQLVSPFHVKQSHGGNCVILMSCRSMEFIIWMHSHPDYVWQRLGWKMAMWCNIWLSELQTLIVFLW